MAFRNRSVNTHNFAMIPRSDVPRSSFRMQKALKTAFDAAYLVPIFCEEVLPGDTFNLKMTAFCRLATPTHPVMDNLHLETFFFFVPNRLVWDNWQKFMGERIDPDDSIDYLVPTTFSDTGGFAIGSIFDYFGLPTAGQVDQSSVVHFNVMPLRAYNLIYNEWFRDENLQDSLTVPRGDGPDTDITIYALRKRGKRHDYFTSCLPWPQKGDAVELPLGDRAPISGIGWIRTAPPDPISQNVWDTADGFTTYDHAVTTTQSPNAAPIAFRVTGDNRTTAEPDFYADLSAATAATINQIRQAFQIQKLLERDARGGTRYTEIIRSHFGVISPDARLQRPEYLGGGHTMVNIHPVAQTSETIDSPQGNLAGFGTAVANQHGFTQSFTEHGYVIGLVNVRADLAYQQGLRRHWSRRTRYDYYFPVFSHLGEQAVLNKEIFCDGTANDDEVFGYQERWAEYRYMPSEITGLMRSTAASTIDAWHYAAEFAQLPVLNDEFIEDTADDVVARTTAVGSAANGQQFLADFFFDIRAARPLPMYSVPGLVDHF